ncbi:unnamed protein product [Symbiodinium sp. CCMP2456]|nr:unnamed protein product [Symbiodinium sp. CCMP2456]
MHKHVMNWLPQIVKRYKSVPAIRTETLRYFACAASYEVAPYARPQDAELEFEEEEGEVKKVKTDVEADMAADMTVPEAVDDDEELEAFPHLPLTADALSVSRRSKVMFQAVPALKEVLDVSPSEALGPKEVAEARHQVVESEPEGRLAFGGLVSLRQSELRLFLAEELERSEDMNALCLAMLCVANFAAYERKVLADEKGGQKLGKYLPLEDMARLLRGVVRTLKSIPSFDDDSVANTMTLHALRFFCNLLAFEIDFITAELQHLNVLEEVGKLFDHWFKDEDKIEDDKLFLQTLQSFILLLRWEIRGRSELRNQWKPRMSKSATLLPAFLIPPHSH